MGDCLLPRWLAPILGAAIGGVLATVVGFHDNSPIWQWRLVFGAALGCGAGTIIMIVDPGRSRRKASDCSHRLIESKWRGDERIQAEPPGVPHVEDPGENVPEVDITGAPATLGGRFLACLAAALCLIPGIGLGWSLTAFLANRHERGWARLVSIIALGVSLLVAHALATVLIVGWIEGP
jgi:hypothetical protein